MTISTHIERRIRAGLPPDPAAVAAVVEPDGLRLGADGLAEAREALASELLGAGPLESLLGEPGVTDILVNGTGAVWLDRGDGLVPASVALGGPEASRRLAVRLAGRAGRRLDDNQPWVDGLLPGGIRLHAILPPLVDGGAHISLRVPRHAGSRLADLQTAGMFDGLTASLLHALVRQRVSLVVTGGTGSGKTTLLGALLAEVPVDERIVLVEDVRELAVPHGHVVRLQARAANVEGRGEVTLVDLVRQALRMRPDRLALGEVRGPEVRELLAALNTGHEGGCGTVHANRPEDLVARFEALGALAQLSRAAVHSQLASAVQAVVHLRRHRGRRVVESLSVVLPGGVGQRSATPLVVPALWCGTGEQAAGWPTLARLTGEAG